MDARLLILLHDEGEIDDDDVLCLHRLMKVERCLLAQEQKFDLAKVSVRDCWKDYRFTKNQLEILREALQFPEFFVTKKRYKLPAMEGLCLLLRRLAYPNRLGDILHHSGKDEAVLSACFNHVLDFVYNQFCDRLDTPDQPWITGDVLETWAEAVQRKGSPFRRCVGFIDGTNVEICR